MASRRAASPIGLEEDGLSDGFEEDGLAAGFEEDGLAAGVAFVNEGEYGQPSTSSSSRAQPWRHRWIWRTSSTRSIAKARATTMACPLRRARPDVRVEPRAASVVVESGCKCIILDQSAFERLLGPVRAILHIHRGVGLADGFDQSAFERLLGSVRTGPSHPRA